MKHYNVFEVADDSCNGTVGTIINCTEDLHGQKAFNKRLKLALEEHFDTTVFFEPITPQDCIIKVDVEGYPYQIEIKETWLY